MTGAGTAAVSAGDAPTTTGPGPDGRVEAQVDRIEHQFAQLFDSYRARLRAQAAAFEPTLQPSGYRTLLEVVVSGPLGGRALAERLGVDKSVLSRQLHQLEELGLVAREPDPSDRRGIVISATPDAVRRVDRIRREARDDFRRGIAQWPAQDLDDLSRLLAQLARLGSASA